MDAQTESILLLELDQAIEEFHLLRERLQRTAAGVSISEEPESEKFPKMGLAASLRP